MIWLTWRQMRTQVAVVYALVAAVAIALALTGSRLADLAKVDPNLFDRLTSTDRLLFYAGIAVVALAPAIIGIFWGAPLVARELEGGTHQLVWNQSVTRTRWLATKLGIATLTTAAGVGALTLAVSWWSDPLDGATSSTRGSLPSRLAPISFAMRAIAPIGYAVFALVLGVTLGIVFRRSLPAMAFTLAIYTLTQIAVPLWVRPHLVPPVRNTVVLSTSTMASLSIDGGGRLASVSAHTDNRDDWILSNDTVDANGQVSALPAWFDDCLPPPPGASVGQQPSKTPVDTTSLEACFSKLADQGYRQRLTYQPSDHFWPLQWVETGLYAAVSVLLAWLCFWWTRHRLS